MINNANPMISGDEKDDLLKRQQSVSSEEAFVFHSTIIMLHFTQAKMLDEFGNLNVCLINF